MMKEEIIREKMAHAIRKDGEGRPILEKTYFEETLGAYIDIIQEKYLRY